MGSEEKAKKAMVDAARLADELRSEQDHTTSLSQGKRALETSLGELENRLAYYGIPDSDCGISEKTPFSADADWNGNSCKAWEANVDASFDGNDQSCGVGGGDENWSSCGFQRHFSWKADHADQNPTAGAFTLDLTADYTGASLTIDPLEINDSSNEAGYTVGGSPWIGGVCKLWIPVPRTEINSVSVAGVHISGNGGAYFESTLAGGSITDTVTGTAYCFSVVNPAEFLSNYNGDAGYLNNGNVAGFRSAGDQISQDNLTDDPFEDLSQTDRQAGILHPLMGGLNGQVTFDDLTDQSPTVNGATGIAKMGANFDVVAHFNHNFCNNFWQEEDMQMEDDWGHGTIDYPDGEAVTGVHTHTDTTDKRFVSNHSSNPTIATLNNQYQVDGSGEMTTTGAGTSGSVRWPNVGAYAGFYSFVSCANVDATPGTPSSNLFKHIYMVGKTGAALPSPACDVGNELGCLTNHGVNEIVPSLGNSMWRYECDGADFSPKMRFNLRQAGSNIRNCGPGTMPDTDAPAKCSWNWNFDVHSENGSPHSSGDAESYFMRNNPKSYAVWDNTSARNGLSAAWGNPTAMTKSKTITVTVGSRAGSTPFTLSVENDVPSQYIDDTCGGACGVTDYTYTFQLNCVAPVNQATRDIFPDCFQGEEIHLSATLDATGNAAAADWTNNMADPWLTTATIADTV